MTMNIGKLTPEQRLESIQELDRSARELRDAWHDAKEASKKAKQLYDEAIEILHEGITDEDLPLLADIDTDDDD